MTHQTANFQIHGGNDAILELLLNESGGTQPLDLAGHRVEFRLSASEGGAVILFKESPPPKGVEVLTPTTLGRADVTFVPSDTEKLGGVYHHETKAIDSANQVSTFLTGLVTIKAMLGATADDAATALIRSRLAEAKLALHRLTTQSLAGELDVGDGHKVKYTPTKPGDLRAYIGELEAQLPEFAGQPARRAIGVRFG